jgi:bifunctional DNase/RNase
MIPRRLALAVVVALLVGPGARRLGAAQAPAPKGLVRMDVHDVKIDPDTHAPLVVLTTAKRNRALLVLIGHAEGLAIAQRLHKLPPPPRPMTHDLLRNVITRLGGTLERMAITKIEDGTFYGELAVRQGKKLVRIDCRPSDGMALALRAGVPIFCAKAVLDEAGVDPGPLPEEPEKPGKPEKFI